jgi:hypothetical protein
MKMLLLGHSSGEWSAKDRPHWKAYMSGIESWCMGFDGDYCHSKLCTPEKLQQYDLIIANADNARGTSMIPELLRLQQHRRSDQKWVTLIEGDARDYLPVLPGIPELFNGSDLVNVLNPRTLEFFRSITKTRCEVIGIPYPAEQIRSLAKPGGRDIFIASRFYHEEHSTLDTLVAAPLAEELGVKACMMFKEAKYNDSRFKCYEEREMRDYLKLIGETARVFINLDLRYTWSRDVLDCAALRIPCISTMATAHADKLFPSLLLDEAFDFTRVRELVRRLYEDQEFYGHVTDISLDRMDEFSHENMNKKLLSYL